MGHQQTVDTPTDIGIREDQLRLRKEMNQADVKRSADKQAPHEFKEPFTFRLRQHKNTQFSGLWELAVLDAKGRVETIITDGDALPNALEAIANIFSNRGF